MKKKICIFSALYLPHMGGIERYTYYIGKTLIQKGYAVTIVTSDIFDLGTDEKTAEGMEIYRLPCIKHFRDRYPILKKNKAFRSVEKKLYAAQFDFIIVNARFYLHSVYGAKFAAKQKIPCITIEHGTTHLSVNHDLLDKLGQILEHGITAVLKRYCKDYYGVSRAACDWSGHFGIQSKGVLYNAVSLDEIQTARLDPVCDYRKDYHISDDTVIITFTGRLLPIKGVMALAKAFEALHMPNTILFYAGDGPCAEQLSALKNDQIILLGQIDFQHIIALLNASDIFCLPSVSEGLSTAVMEAVAADTFIITTKTGGTKELICSPEHGIVMKSHSVTEITEALKKAIADPLYRKSAIVKSKQRLNQYFTFDQTAEKLISIIEETPIPR